MKPQVYRIKNTELYLEGYKVPFVSISISESVGAFPAAQIELAASVNASRILPGTIVQVFTEIDGSKIGEPFLLFEGKITGIAYTKGVSQESVSIKCYSLLGNFISTTLRPIDSIMTSSSKTLSGNAGGKVDKFKVKIMTATAGNAEVNEGEDYALGVILGQHNTSTLKKLINTAATEYAKEVALGSQDTIGIPITHLAGLNDEFLRLAGNKFPFNEGDYSQLFYYFGRAFERNDVYFGLESIAFKLIPSMINVPNPRNQNAFRVRAAQSALQSLSQYAGALGGSSGLKNLMEAFTEVLGKIEYTMIAPSIFPAMTAILTDNKTTTIPGRFIFLPEGEMGPPALCNTVFPDEIVNISYSRDMISEPTRVISQIQYSMLSDIPDWAWPNFVVPDTSVKKVKGKVQTSLTFEECYRGINLKFATLDGTFGQLLAEKSKENGDKKIKKDIKEQGGPTVVAAGLALRLGKEVAALGKTDLDNTTNVLYSHGYQQFNEMRGNAKTASITTQWSPYRFIGMPILAFDKSGPSIVGKLQSINTSINANGVAQSQLSVASARLIYDATEEDNSAYSELLIPEVLIDPISAYNTGIFNKELYGFSVVGEFLYNLLEYSAVPKESIAKDKLTSKISDSKAPKKTTMWDNYKNIESDDVIDGSILKFVKTKTNGRPEIDTKLLTDTLDYYNEKKMPYEYKLNIILQSAIKNLKNLYLGLISNDSIDNSTDPIIRNFIEEVTYRKVMTKSAYLNFLELDLSADIKYNSKNLHAIMYSNSNNLDPVYNASQLKDVIKKTVTTEPEHSYDNIQLPTLDGTEIYPGLSKQDVVTLQSEINKLEAELKDYNKDNLKADNISAFIIDNYQKLYDKLTKTYSLNSLIPEGEFKVYMFTTMRSKPTAFNSTQEKTNREEFLTNLGLTSSSIPTKSEFTFNLLISLSQNILIKQQNLEALRMQLADDKALKEKSKVKSQNGDVNDIKAIYKPFNIIRYAHVVKAFQYMQIANGPFQQDQDIIVRGN